MTRLASAPTVAGLDRDTLENVMSRLRHAEQCNLVIAYAGGRDSAGRIAPSRSLLERTALAELLQATRSSSGVGSGSDSSGESEPDLARGRRPGEDHPERRPTPAYVLRRFGQSPTVRREVAVVETRRYRACEDPAPHRRLEDLERRGIAFGAGHEDRILATLVHATLVRPCIPADPHRGDQQASALRNAVRARLAGRWDDYFRRCAELPAAGPGTAIAELGDALNRTFAMPVAEREERWHGLLDLALRKHPSTRAKTLARLAEWPRKSGLDARSVRFDLILSAVPDLAPADRDVVLPALARRLAQLHGDERPHRFDVLLERTEGLPPGPQAGLAALAAAVRDAYPFPDERAAAWQQVASRVSAGADGACVDVALAHALENVDEFAPAYWSTLVHRRRTRGASPRLDRALLESWSKLNVDDRAATLFPAIELLLTPTAHPAREADDRSARRTRSLTQANADLSGKAIRALECCDVVARRAHLALLLPGLPRLPDGFLDRDRFERLVDCSAKSAAGTTFGYAYFAHFLQAIVPDGRLFSNRGFRSRLAAWERGVRGLSDADRRRLRTYAQEACANLPLRVEAAKRIRLIGVACG